MLPSDTVRYPRINAVASAVRLIDQFLSTLAIPARVFYHNVKYCLIGHCALCIQLNCWSSFLVFMFNYVDLLSKT